MVNFSLSETQEEKFNIWKERIKEIFGEYGYFSFTFKPYEMRTSIYIYSDLLKEYLDLSEVESW